MYIRLFPLGTQLVYEMGSCGNQFRSIDDECVSSMTRDDEHFFVIVEYHKEWLKLLMLHGTRGVVDVL